MGLKQGENKGKLYDDIYIKCTALACQLKFAYLNDTDQINYDARVFPLKKVGEGGWGRKILDL